MTIDLNVAALGRTLADIRDKFQNHPQAAEMATVIYVFLGLLFLIVTGMVLDVAPSILLAYIIGLSAIGLSAYTLNRLLKGPASVARAEPEAPVDLAQRLPIDPPQLLEVHDISRDEAAVEITPSAPAPAPAAVVEADPEPEPVPATIIFRRSPIVAIPQRKVALISGDIEFADGTAIAGPSVEIDELRLAHGISFAINSEAGAGRTILIPLSRESLDSHIIDEFIDLADEIPGLIGRIVFELPAGTLDNPDSDLAADLKQLRKLGVHFAARRNTLFKVSDFITHGELWSEFSYILMPATLILETTPDIIKLVEHLGPRLIALGLSSNDTLLEILDYHVPLAGGPLFEKVVKAEPAVPKAKTRSRPANSAPAKPAPKRSRTSAAKPIKARRPSTSAAKERA